MGTFAIPVPAIYANESKQSIASTFDSIMRYVMKTSTLPNADRPSYMSMCYEKSASLFPQNIDFASGIYSAAIARAKVEGKEEAVRELSKLLVAPSLRSIELMYRSTTFSNECIPSRSQSYDSIVNL